jgi:hypothetical protein
MHNLNMLQTMRYSCLCVTLLEKLGDMDLNVVAQLEHECLPSIIDLELKRASRASLGDQISVVKRECNEVASSLQEELGRASSQMSLFDTSINLDSPTGAHALLRLGIDVDSTSEWNLRRVAETTRSSRDSLLIVL